MWRIYDYRGVGKAVVHEVEYEGNEGEVRTLTCSINSPMPIEWEVTDNVRYRGETFYLRHIPSAKKQARKGTHEEAFVYDNVVFYSAIDELASCDFLDVVKEDNNLHYTSLPNFSFYCETIHDIADRLQANLDRLYTGSKKWTIQVSTDATAKVDIKPQALSFSSEKCSQVLERIHNDLGVTYEHTNRTIVFGAKPIMMPYEFQYGKGKGLKSIEQSGADGNALVTRARVYGSTRNLPNRYYNKLYKNSKTGAVMYFKTDEDKPKDFETYWKPLISETMYVPNLMLPMFRENGKDAYIDATDAIAKYGLREGTKFFDSNNGEDEEIYPTIENMTADRLEELGYTPELHDGDNGKLDELLYVDDVPFSGVMPEGGSLPSSESHFVVYLKDIGFDINDYWVGTPKISFRSGALAGREFDIVKCEQTALINKTYKLTCKRVEDTSIQLIFPYKDYKPSAGDKFVLLEIDMPEIYIKVAELRLKEEGEKWLGLNSNPIFTYNPEIDAVNVLRNPKIAENLKEGRTFIFADEDLGISKAIRISNLKIKDNGFCPEYEITLSDKHTVSLAEKVTQSVVNMIGSNNASTENIKALIEAYGNNLFLSKKKRDTADQVIRFTLGLEIGENKANINANGDAEVESLTSRSRVKASEVVADSIHTTDFAQGALSGTGGAIYQLEGATYAEFDYITARQGATFAELIIQEYRSIGGALVISQANGEIESITERYDATDDLDYFDIKIKDWDKNPQFVVGDLVRCLYWDFDNNEYVSYWVEVKKVLSNGISLLVGDFTQFPKEGNKLVQMGNTTDKSRQGCILLTTENSLPRMAILDGIDEPKIYNTKDKTNYKGIYGSLDGFVDPYTGKALSGYGMWGENVHLHGDLILSSTNKSVADSIKDAGNGRNLLLGTNRGVENWKFNSSLSNSTNNPYMMQEVEYNGAKGVRVWNYSNGSATYEIFYYPLRPQFIKKGKTYHLSFDLMQSASNSELTFKFIAQLSNAGSGNVITNQATITNANGDGVWRKYDVTFIATENGSVTSGQVVYFNITPESRQWIDFAIANLKLEEGVKSTEWTSAPEDVSTDLDNFITEIGKEFEVTNGKFESVQYKIEGATSARNLLLKTNEEIKSNAYLMGSYNLGNAKPQKGDVVTLSFIANVSDDRITRFRVFNSGGMLVLQNKIPINKWGEDFKISTTFTWNINDSDGNTHINLYQTNDSYEQIQGLYGDTTIKNIKLEFGSVATDWGVAPEETESRIKQTAESIELNVKNGLTKTGIDIENKKIEVTADNFIVRNNEGKQTAGVDRFGNLSANTIMTRFANGKLAITANQSVIDVESNQVSTDRMLKFYYDNDNNNIQFEIGWDATTSTLMRYYTTDGTLLWGVGNEKGFVTPTANKVIRQKQYWYLGSFSEITAERAFIKASNESADNVIDIYGQSFEYSSYLDNFYFDEQLYNPVSGYIATEDYTEFEDGRDYRVLYRIENGKLAKTATAWRGSNSDDIPNDWKE